MDTKDRGDGARFGIPKIRPSITEFAPTAVRPRRRRAARQRRSRCGLRTGKTCDIGKRRVHRRGGGEEEEFSAFDLANFSKSLTGGENVDEENINEWINCDADEPGFERLSDGQIVNGALGTVSESEGEEEENDENVDEENINEWINCDANNPGFECLSDEQIVSGTLGTVSESEGEEEENDEVNEVKQRLSDEQIVSGALGTVSESEGEEEENDEVNEVKQVSHEATLKHIDGIIKYLEEQDDTTL
ncbi:Hypothetical protein CINCED_3A023089 [Cinara cedri]|uniref:Uncharacterized protein n=1 Tax=Cinara cedri TaxID=506608 RepID=A0A5E4N4V5_9HEMI|nr:Hypothetical protein CINCED_3A023089 [Cinara cedri]